MRAPWAAAIAAPPFFALWSILRFGVDVPFGDEWLYVPLLEKVHAGTLRLSDVWAPYNEHRLLFLHLMSLGLAQVTGFNRVADMVAGIGLRVPTLLLACVLLRETLPARPLLRGALAVVASVFLFSAVGFQSWFEGISALGWSLTGLGLVTVVWAVTRPLLRWRHVGVAMLATTLSLYGFAPGLLLPFVGFTGIAANSSLRGARPPLPKLLGWLAFSVAALALYFQGLTRRAEVEQAGSGFLIANSERVTRYVFAYLGAPLVFGTSHQLPAVLALAGSLTLLLAFGSLVFGKRESTARALPWLLLVLFAFGNGLVTALARLPLLPNVDFVVVSNRYTTVSAFFWISVITVGGLALDGAGPSRRRSVVQAAGLGLLATVAVLVAVANRRAYAQFLPTSSTLRAGRTYLHAFRTSPDEMIARIHPQPRIVRERAPVLESLRLGPFREHVGLLLGEAEVDGFPLSCVPWGPGQSGPSFVGVCDDLARVDVRVRGPAGNAGDFIEIREFSQPQGSMALGHVAPPGDEGRDGWVSVLLGPVSASRGRTLTVTAERRVKKRSTPQACFLGRSAADTSAGGDRLLVRQACVLPVRGRVIARLAAQVGPVRETTLFIDGQVRPVIAAHPPTRLSWALLAPRSASAVLRTSVALDPAVWDKRECDGVTFRIRVEEGGGRSVVLFERHLNPRRVPVDRRWVPVSVDLLAFAGRSVTLYLETDAGPAANVAFDWAAWELPVLETAP